MTTVTGAPQSQAPSPLAAIKAKQQAMWASGDFSIVGTTLQIVGERLCEAVDVRATDRVLDVAAGNGNATLAAARHFAEVVSTDYVPELFERGRRRADAEGLGVAFQQADAEALPFEDDRFDVVLSTFGVMFAPDHEAAAREMSRVCRRGGRIGLASWTPEGFIGEMFRVTARHVPPPAGTSSTCFADATVPLTRPLRPWTSQASRPTNGICWNCSAPATGATDGGSWSRLNIWNR